jgi:hypothetical protein
MRKEHDKNVSLSKSTFYERFRKICKFKTIWGRVVHNVRDFIDFRLSAPPEVALASVIRSSSAYIADAADAADALLHIPPHVGRLPS